MVRFFKDADIASSLRCCGLDRVRCDSDFVHTGSFSSSINEDFSGGSRFRFVSPMVVILDVVASNLQVSDL